MYKFLRPGGVLLGSNHNHDLSPDEIEAIKKYGLIFDKERYEDGEKVSFIIRNIQDTNDQGCKLFDYWYTNDTT
jgi:hypothetical protein